jgi:hypothetical protein
MKMINHMAREGHRFRSPVSSPDLFDYAREREQARAPAVSKLSRRYGLSIAMASLVAQLSGLGGAQHG